MVLLVILCLLVDVSKGQSIGANKNTGPYYIPDWNTPTFDDHKQIGDSDVIIYQENLKAYLFSSRAWRFVQTWKFLNRHYPEINSYVIVPDQVEVRDWIEKRQCKVGTTYETSREDDCYRDLDVQKRETWVNPKTLKTTPPATRPYMSTCSIYYSCDIHDVTFPIYINEKNHNPYISGPHGENIDVSGDGSLKVIKMEDSFLVYYSLPKKLDVKKANPNCIWQGSDPLLAKLYCNYNFENAQYTILFNVLDDNSVLNNIIFFRPKFQQFFKAPLKGSSDPATKGDLAELQDKLLLSSKDNVFLFHELLQELSNVKHILKALILSVAKIDDNLLGKITRIPVKTKWLNDEVFILTSNVESLYHFSTTSNNSCLGSYVYDNGRWKIATKDENTCSNWNSTFPLKIMENMMRSPLEILNAPEYRNASSGYSGWTFLDNGKVSLDWLDKGLKYYKEGDGFDFKLGGLNIVQILMLVAYVIIAIIAISLITTILKMFKK